MLKKHHRSFVMCLTVIYFLFWKFETNSWCLSLSLFEKQMVNVCESLTLLPVFACYLVSLTGNNTCTLCIYLACPQLNITHLYYINRYINIIKDVLWNIRRNQLFHEHIN